MLNPSILVMLLNGLSGVIQCSLRLQHWSGITLGPLVPLSYGKQSIGCKWFFCIIYNSDGLLERYKTCLFAKGFTQQQEGIDYFETFSLVAKITLVVSDVKGWYLE